MTDPTPSGASPLPHLIFAHQIDCLRAHAFAKTDEYDKKK
ncbi:hypothetical protein C4J96_3548 [Pseudomonas orientalis]|nr:hypothetical protein C4J96_3548 [Pseudomonas orientalis]